MLTITPDRPSRRFSSERAAVQAAHFDATFLSEAGAEGNGDHLRLLVAGLAARDKRLALLEGVAGGTGAPRGEPDANGGAFQQTIQLREEICARAAGPRSTFGAAAKLLCIDDRLFSLEGGTQLARTSVAAARRAGRSTALLCADVPTAFSRRDDIIDCFGGDPDYVIGQPAAVLSFYGLSRVDTLVPRLLHRGAGLMLHRADYPSICIRRQGVFETGSSPISREAFWSDFVPSRLDGFPV